jgi:PEGA domain
MRRLALVVALAAGGAAGGPVTEAWAQQTPPPSKEALAEAATRYSRGLALAQEENHRGALVEFRRAYDLTKEYRVLYNIGQVCNFLQDYVCTITSFETYLVRGGTDLRDERRAEVEGLIAKLKPRIASLSIQANVFGADVSIDDAPGGKTPIEAPVRLNPGPHKIAVTMAGKVPFTRSFETAGGDHVVMKVELKDVPPPPSAALDKGAPRAASRVTPLSWVGWSAGAALAIGSGTFAALALAAHAKIGDTQFAGSRPPQALLSQSTNVKTYDAIADVCGLAAIAALATTTVLTLTHKPEREARAALSIDLGPTSASLRGEF